MVEPGAHKGVIGIVAGQRMRATGRPSAVGTVLDGIAHCSVRAPEGYDLRPALDLLRPYLLSGGGHRYAAGLTFPIGHLGFIRKTLERVAAEQAGGAPAAALLVDGAGTALAPPQADLERLEPFGQAFPEPLLVVRGPAGRAGQDLRRRPPQVPARGRAGGVHPVRRGRPDALDGDAVPGGVPPWTAPAGAAAGGWTASWRRRRRHEGLVVHQHPEPRLAPHGRRHDPGRSWA